MSGLKPIGSEKLQGDEKIKRILEIAKYKEVTPNSINESTTTDYQVKLADGNVYEIAKEKMGYVIKKQINESVSEYIEPMKNRKFYSSYSSAFKRLNLLAKEVNQLTETEEGISLFTEQKKYTLKTPKSMMGTPEAEPAIEPTNVPADAEVPAEPMGPADAEIPSEPTTTGPEEPMDDMAAGDEEMPEPSDEPADDEPVTYKSIQKLVGRLSQKLRDYSDQEELSSKDAKYIINSILSAIDLNSLEDEDKEEIISRFDSENEEMSDMGDEEMPDMGDEETSDMGDEEMPEPSDEMTEEFGEEYELETETEMKEEDYLSGVFNKVFKESKVDSILEKYFVINENEKKFIKEKKVVNKKVNENKLKYYGKEIKRLSESVKQTKVSYEIMKNFPEINFVGKTNKGNLVFENKNQQLKVTPNGQIL